MDTATVMSDVLYGHLYDGMMSTMTMDSVAMMCKLPLVAKGWNERFKTNPSDICARADKVVQETMPVFARSLRTEKVSIRSVANSTFVLHRFIELLSNLPRLIARRSGDRYQKYLKHCINRGLFVDKTVFMTASIIRHSNTINLLCCLYDYLHRTESESGVNVRVDMWVFYAFMDYNRMLYEWLPENSISINKRYRRMVLSKSNEALSLRKHVNMPSEFSYKLRRLLGDLNERVTFRRLNP